MNAAKAKAKSAVTAPHVTMVVVEGSLNPPPFRPHVSEQQKHDRDGFPAEQHDQGVFQNSNMIEMVFLQNGMIREFFTEFFMNSSMIDMVFVQNGMIREFLNNHNMGMIVLMIFGMSAEPLNNHNMGMVVFLNSNSVVN